MINPITSIIEYVRTSIAELKKVTWPTKAMTLRYTAIVVVASVALAAFFAVLDFGFSKAVTAALAQKTAPAAVQEAPVVPDLEATSVESTDTPAQDGNLQLDLNNSATSVK